MAKSRVLSCLVCPSEMLSLYVESGNSRGSGNFGNKRAKGERPSDARKAAREGVRVRAPASETGAHDLVSSAGGG